MTTASLAAYKFAASYGRFIPELNRREIPSESFERVIDMHRTKYKGFDIEAELKTCLEAMKAGLVLGSQRALQFGGAPILRKEARAFNCSGSYADRPRFFQECLYLLLCGCGTGFSAQRHHVAKLPKLIAVDKHQIKVFTVADSVEGWADALGVLLASYGCLDASMEDFAEETARGDDSTVVFKHPGCFADYVGSHVSFDYSRIRNQGSSLSTGAGKAPGPGPLSASLEKIRGVLDAALTRCHGEDCHLRPIDAYDIIMHASDAVLAGGVRRSATICLFSVDDPEMMNAKTGNWMQENPQRARSNNSAMLIRSETSWEAFHDIFMLARRQYGEPGFVWSDSTELMVNPCQPACATVLTPDGLRTFADIDVGSVIWSREGWTRVLRKWSTGIKPVSEYRTSAGVFVGTTNHRVEQQGEKVEVGLAESIDVLTAGLGDAPVHSNEGIMVGLLLGDGTWHKAGGGLLLNVGAGDQEIFDCMSWVLREGYGGSTRLFKVQDFSLLTQEDMPTIPFRRIPKRFLQAGRDVLCSVLRGLYSANGSVVANRVTLKTCSPGLRDDVQVALSSLGIRSYFTTNRAHDVEFGNGVYTCKESYDINVSVDRCKFAKLIGFIHSSKTARLSVACDMRSSGRTPDTYAIRSVTALGDMEVYDITVDNESHTYWTGGHSVSNCVETGMYPAISSRELDEINGIRRPEGFEYADTEYSGFSFCNLCEINAKACRTDKDWGLAGTAAAILGTLQAGYTKFDYLGKVSEAIAKREALLGVSMTGMMDNPAQSFDPRRQRALAQLILDVNAHLAPRLGIRPTARATCVKPAGSTSCLLGTSSGIHAQHAKRYFRRAQANINEAPFQYFKVHNPDSVERSVWEPNGNTAVITFCIEASDEALTRREVNGLKQLEYVKLTQDNWVAAGNVPERAAKPWLHHNVSNTITIRQNQEEAAARYIYDHRESFTGVSILATSGDLDYPQAPFCEVRTESEILERYGRGAFFASGLIVDGLHAFGNNLWLACDTVMGLGEASVLANGVPYPGDPNALPDAIRDAYEHVHGLKKDWVRRAIQFAKNYFQYPELGTQTERDAALKRMTYCIKEVNNLHLWERLTRSWRDVDYSLMVEETDGTKGAQPEMACAGGACTLQHA